MRFLVAILAAGFLCSCAAAFRGRTIGDPRWYEYDIPHPSQGDVRRVRELLHDVAAEAGIPRHYGGEYSPQPIAVYKGDDVDLDAVIEHAQLRILLTRSDSPPTPSFTRTKDSLERALARTFGSRAITQPPVRPHTVIGD